MFVCFLRPGENEDVECRIIKYLDRIWLDKNGNGEVMRTFIVEVSKGDLTQISCLIPHERQNVSNLKDYSRLSTNSQYPFNAIGRQTGEISVINESTVVFDDLTCRVSHNHRMELHPYSDGTTIRIDLRDAPISARAKELIRFKYNLRNLVHFAPTAGVFKFSYFCPERCRNGFSSLSGSRKIIPVIPILDESSLQGGFDIFIYPPPECQVTSDIGKYSARDIDCDSKGTPISRTNGVLWRLRNFIKEPTKEINLDKVSSTFNVRLDIDGSIVRPASFEHVKVLRERIDRSTTMSLTALIVAIISVAGLYLPKLISWMLSLIQQTPAKPTP